MMFTLTVFALQIQSATGENCHTKDLQENWTQEKKNWCCETESIACQYATGENCYTKDLQENWTQKKKNWCCENESIACPGVCWPIKENVSSYIFCTGIHKKSDCENESDCSWESFE